MTGAGLGRTSLWSIPASMEARGESMAVREEIVSLPLVTLGLAGKFGTAASRWSVDGETESELWRGAEARVLASEKAGADAGFCLRIRRVDSLMVPANASSHFGLD